MGVSELEFWAFSLENRRVRNRLFSLEKIKNTGFKDKKFEKH
jgi:hypothetical protein